METGKSKGQSLLEFALTLPILVWLVLGLFDLGRGVACYSLLTNSAREGARAGIFPLTDDATIINAVNSQTIILGNIPSRDITITPAAQSDRTSGSSIDVTVVYHFQPVTPLVANVVGSTITMTASSDMPIE